MPVRVRPGVPYGSVAQSAERLAVNQDVAGSSPAGIAIAGEPRPVEWRMPTLKKPAWPRRGMRPADANRPIWMCPVGFAEKEARSLPGLP